MDNPRVIELLEEVLESGRAPEEACAGSPELLREVRARLRQCLQVDAAVSALFPPRPGDAFGAASAGTRSPGPSPPHPLPRVPGYDVESVLGRGGMGVVYKARQLRLNRAVALKMILGGPCVGRSDLSRFAREAEAVASLRHAHIVQVYDVGDFDGLPYFTMEHVEGGTLAQKLAGTPQPAARAAELVATLAGAVEAAHRAGIIHRDLKPSNILLAADGTAKITDFGLSRHFGDDHTLTLSGTRLGTPSYMAPEQAQGRAGAVGPAADVYSLGAILYELLTGRPPFRAETATATLLQVIHQEAAAPSRLNAKVPRDLETVCLKCLRKDPQRRYASAAALGDDLRRFLEGRPIEARPPGLTGRVWRWCRREPAAAALLATAVAAVSVAVGGAFWVQSQQAAAREAMARQEGQASQAVLTALAQADALREQGRWPGVRAALSAAQNLVTPATPASVRDRLRSAVADADLVARLEDVRMWDGTRRRGATLRTLDELYADAFRSGGINPVTADGPEVAKLVNASPVRLTVVAFLNDWLFWASDAKRRSLRAVIELVDDDAWRREFREALASRDRAKLNALAGMPDVPAQPPVVLSAVSIALDRIGNADRARTLLRDAQRRNPGDFWINYQLGEFCREQHPHEAAGYFRAAVAVRPDSDQAYTRLGEALRDAGDADGATMAFRKAIALNPDRGRVTDLARLLAPQGRLEDAKALWGRVLSRDPADHDQWYGYAQLCLFLGDEPAYRRTRTALLERFGGRYVNWPDAERVALASLLLPPTKEELAQVAGLVDHAVKAGSDSPDAVKYLTFLRGLLEFRQGHLERAVPLLRAAAAELPNRPGPRLVLAMAEFQSGAESEARRTLAAAVRSYNWRSPQADHPTARVNHVLRREAESLILPNLPAFTRGEHRPRDNDERFALLGVCQFEDRHAAAARLYADAFAGEPGLADALTADCIRRASQEDSRQNQAEVLNGSPRYLAARAAALAGCGQGRDAADVGDGERVRWRTQASEWLRAELAVHKESLRTAGAKERRVSQRALAMWRVEPDFSVLRAPASLPDLREGEREEWSALWQSAQFALDQAD
jgi:serine/threonine-protein kinase